MVLTLRSLSVPKGCARLSWAAFDAAVDAMAEMVKDRAPRARSIRGVPRGGLPLAVALSHRTGLPLATPEDVEGVVVVDDVVETGRTFREWGAAADLFLCWISKTPEVPAQFVIRLPADVWIIFPWEDAKAAVVDAEWYYQSREASP